MSRLVSRHLHDVRSYFRRYGYGKTVLRVLTDSLRQARILRISRFIVLQPDHINSSAFSPEVSYERSLLPAAGMRQYQSQLPDQLPESFLVPAEQRDDYCYAMFDKRRLVSFGWYATRSAHLFDRCLYFNHDFVYMYHGFTRPEYRGQRLHALGLAEAMTIFQQRKKSAIVSTVNITNYGARRSAARLGFRCRGNIIQVGPGWLGLLFVTPGARACGVRLQR